MRGLPHPVYATCAGHNPVKSNAMQNQGQPIESGRMNTAPSESPAFPLR